MTHTDASELYEAPLPYLGRCSPRRVAARLSRRLRIRACVRGEVLSRDSD